LVTQGTVANDDLGQLVGPTLSGLGDRDDLLIIVTTGGRPVEAVPGPIPSNARVAEFLDYNWLFPRLDAMVTNGGYGTVNHALRHGLPLVVAGKSEDKAEIAARVAWSGAGINLNTEQPSAAAVAEAVEAVLGDSQYRNRASSLSGEFARYDVEFEILRAVAEVTEAQQLRRRL
jgi:UDP:flavonoid glycosyltransferase YjiC (YdhE family)